MSNSKNGRSEEKDEYDSFGSSNTEEQLSMLIGRIPDPVATDDSRAVRAHFSGRTVRSRVSDDCGSTTHGD